jgi:hypothetical protein
VRSRREDGPQLQIVPPAHRVVAPRHRDPRVDPWTDFPLLRLNSRLKCPRCGSRYIVVMFHPSATTASFRARASLMLLRATHGVFGKSSPAGRVRAKSPHWRGTAVPCPPYRSTPSPGGCGSPSSSGRWQTSALGRGAKLTFMATHQQKPSRTGQGASSEQSMADNGQVWQSTLSSS